MNKNMTVGEMTKELGKMFVRIDKTLGGKYCCILTDGIGYDYFVGDSPEGACTLAVDGVRSGKVAKYFKSFGRGVKL